MQAEGTAIGEARDKIWMMDIDGLLARGRPEGRLEGTYIFNCGLFHSVFEWLFIYFSYFIAGHKAFYAKEHDVMKNLEEIVNEVKPAVLIGITSKTMNPVGISA